MVLLPAPLGPTMAKISPGATVNDTSSTARMPPNETEMLCASNSGAAGASDVGRLVTSLLVSATLTARAPSSGRTAGA
jgi:hypothetical protein